MENTYWNIAYMYVYETWACLTGIWPIFGPEGSNKNVFDFIADLYNIITFNWLCFYLS